MKQFCLKNQINLRLYHNYFEKQSTGIKNGYRSLCSFPYNAKGQRIESDALFLMERNHQKRLFAVEFYNDEKVIRVMRALERYRLALSFGQPSESFGLESNTHVWFVFRKESMVSLVEKRLLADFKRRSFLPYFHFTALEEVLRGNGVPF